MTREPELKVYLAPEPFSARRETLIAAAGQPIEQALLLAVRQEKLALDDLERVVVYLDGVDLEEALGDRDAVLAFVPPAGSILNIAVEPMGGGGGKKALQTILSIAVVALSFWVGGPAGPLATSSLLLRTAAAAAVNVAGQMAIAAAFAPGKPDSLPDANDRRALEGTSNDFNPRGPFALQLGEERVGPQMGAAPYTQNEGDDSFLHLIVTWHYGKCTVADIKIGETALGAYPAADIQVEHFLEPGPNRRSFLYPADVVQTNFTDELEQDVWEVHTSAAAAERLEVDVTLPAGLKYTKESGSIVDQGIPFTLQTSPAGENDWTAAPLDRVYKGWANENLGAGLAYIKARTNDAIRRTFKILPAAPGQYDVRVKIGARGFHPDDDDRSVHTTVWTALRSIKAGDPVLDETVAWSAIRIRSSDDLNGNLPTITGVVTPVVPIWEGGNWDTEAPTSNEAALARWLLMGPAAAKPLRADQIDASCATAYELIEANGWGAGVQIRDEISQQDALLRLGRAGRFSTYWNGRALCFVTDWEKPFPRQVFAAGNASGYRYRRVFPEPLHGVIVEYKNAEAASGSDELVVYADGQSEETAELLETIRLDFACDAARAFKEGRVFLAKRELLVEVHEWTAGADSVASTYGDRVLVRHPSTLYGLVDSRVDNRFWTGALVAGVRLGQPVTMEAGKTYSIDFRRAGEDAEEVSVVRGLAIVNSETTTRNLYFAAPLPVDETPGKDDLVVFGETGVVTEDVEIVDREAAGQFEATFRAVRYLGPEIMAAETGEIPELVSAITQRPAAPQPRIIGAGTGDPGGVRVAFDVDPVRGALIDGFSARWRISQSVDGDRDNPWNSLRPLPPTARELRTPPLLDAIAAAGDEGEFRVDVEVRSVIRTTDVSEPALAEGILVAKALFPPTNLTAVGVTRTGSDGSSYAAIAIEADALVAGDVQDLVVEVKLPAEDADAWRSAGQPLSSRNPVGDFRNVAGGRSYDVRAKWRSADNWSSAWVQTVAPVAVPLGDVASNTVNVGSSTAVQVNADVASLIADVVDLYTVFGDTESAAASALAAAAAQIAAELAQANAETARDDAAASYTAADAAADAAVASALAASGSQGAAAGSATSAASSASAAAGSASAASASATAASTSAGAASTSASNAATSATNAAGSASSAATSSTTAASARDAAQGVANRLIPQRPAIAADFIFATVANYTTVAAFPPDYASFPAAAGSVVNVAGEGDVREINGSTTSIQYTRGWLAVGTGRTFTVDSRARTTVDGSAAFHWYLGFGAFTSSGAYLGLVNWNPVDTSWVVADGWRTMSASTTSTAILALYPTAAYVRGLTMGYHATIASTAQFASIWFRDTTDNAAADAAASAAATSASSAAASQSAAGTSASAANTSATNAATSASNASTSATNASNSATTAAGSASAASSSATLAATARDAAQATAKQLLPSAFDQDGLFFTEAYNTFTAPADLAASATVTFPAVASIGKVVQTTAYKEINSKGYLTLVAGRTYRGSIRTRLTVDPVTNGPLKVYLYFWLFNSSGTSVGSGVMISPLPSLAVADGWQTFTVEKTTAQILAVQSTTAFIRVGTSTNYGAVAATTGATQEIQWLRLEDVTSEIASGASASAAATSASAASASATAAGGSATSATTSANTATTQAGNASTSASSASTSAAAASSSASAASSSATLAASVGSASINSNPVFALYPTTPGFPTGWSGDTLGANPTRVAGNISPYAARTVGAAGAFAYMAQTEASSPGLALAALRQNMYLMLEAEVTLVSGALTGAGVLFYATNASYATTTVLKFGSHVDITGAVVGAGTTGKTYRFSRLIRLTDASFSAGYLYACTHHSDLGSMAAANSLDWHKCLVRPATQTDIDGLATAATVSTHASAIATLNGRNTAYLVQETFAGSGSTAFVALRSETSPGVIESNVGLGARTISFYNPTAAAWVLAARIEAGDAVFTGNLTAGKKIKAGAGGGWEVAYESKAYLVADGEAVSLAAYGFTSNPVVYFEPPGTAVPALSAGEVFNFYAGSLTPTGFTARIRKATPGGSTTYTSTGVETPGTGPAQQMDKVNAADAATHYYNFRLTGSYTTIKYQDGAPAGFVFPEQPWIYAGFVQCSTWFYTGSGSWVEGDFFQHSTYVETPYTGHPTDPGGQTISFTNYDHPSYFGSALGLHGGNEFGISDIIGGSLTWVNVNYVGNGASGDATATPGGEKVRAIVVPRNAAL